MSRPGWTRVESLLRSLLQESEKRLRQEETPGVPVGMPGEFACVGVHEKEGGNIVRSCGKQGGGESGSLCSSGLFRPGRLNLLHLLQGLPLAGEVGGERRIDGHGKIHVVPEKERAGGDANRLPI